MQEAIVFVGAPAMLEREVIERLWIINLLFFFNSWLRFRLRRRWLGNEKLYFLLAFFLFVIFTFLYFLLFLYLKFSLKFDYELSSRF